MCRAPHSPNSLPLRTTFASPRATLSTAPDRGGTATPTWCRVRCSFFFSLLFFFFFLGGGGGCSTFGTGPFCGGGGVLDNQSSPTLKTSAHTRGTNSQECRCSANKPSLGSATGSAQSGSCSPGHSRPTHLPCTIRVSNLLGFVGFNHDPIGRLHRGLQVQLH